MKLKYGLDIDVDFNSMTFKYGKNVQGPKEEIRHLDDIRQSLLDFNSVGPDKIYSIIMDVYKKEDYEKIKQRNLLFGVVAYAKGKIGQEPIRSQGHIHAKSSSSNMSTGELYEIWSGKAVIYMQESSLENAGKCYAVYAEVGQKVLVPPGWVHATISLDPDEELVFGAWCVRDFGFEYDQVRKRHGIAYFPIFKDDKLIWQKNENYTDANLIIKKPRIYEELNITNEPIYEQFQKDNDKFLFISRPNILKWDNFTP